MQYRTLKRIWHRLFQAYIDAGEIVPLNHLTNDEIELLVSKGIIAIIPEPVKNIVAVPPKKRVGTPKKRKKVVRVKKKPVEKVEKKVSGMSTHIEKEPVKPVIKLNEEK